MTTSSDTEFPVQLYVYDLSRGLARQMSLALTGRQIDGIWHTSIVAWDREYFFGQGISVVHPGTSHHGAPIETLNLGITALDRETFEHAILPDLQQQFTATSYNLLSWNCNNFTQQVSQILTGNDIPAHIQSLPQDFLSTPFGQMLRPQIDAMFRSATPSSSLSAPLPNPIRPAATNNLLNQVASRAYSGNTALDSDASSSDPVRHITSKSQLDSLISVYPCVAVLFTSESCPPCRIIKPAFSDLAYKHYQPQHNAGSHKRIAFAQVEAGPASSPLFQACSIFATPTVVCYTKRKLSNQVKGADVAQLKVAVDLMLFEVYPFHPHTQLKKPLASIPSIPSKPHKFTTAPKFASAIQKLDTLISEIPSKSFTEKVDIQDARRTIASRLIPWLETRFETESQPIQPLDPQLVADLDKAYATLSKALATPSIFPLIDLMRIAVLDETFVQQSLQLAKQGQDTKGGPVLRLLSAVSQFASVESQWQSSHRPIYLTTSRLLANLSSSSIFLDAIEYHDPLRTMVAELLSTLLLSPDSTIRSSAATVSFNLALHQHHQRPNWICNDETSPLPLGSRFGSTWETQITSALIQSILDEQDSDETLHRLSASLLLTLYLSPFWNNELVPLLQVLDASDTFQQKIHHVVVENSTKKSELLLLLGDLSVLCQLSP